MAKQPKDLDQSYHIDHFDKCDPHWPRGAWSVYQINGEQIANRTVWEHVNPEGYYEGKIIARHGWCGYLGMWETLPEAMAAIEADLAARRQRV